jgi:hypothetical protein
MATDKLKGTLKTKKSSKTLRAESMLYGQPYN